MMVSRLRRPGRQWFSRQATRRRWLTARMEDMLGRRLDSVEQIVCDIAVASGGWPRMSCVRWKLAVPSARFSGSWMSSTRAVCRLGIQG